jgi:hypothetical protein
MLLKIPLKWLTEAHQTDSRGNRPGAGYFRASG